MQARCEDRLTGARRMIGGVARYENDYYHQVSKDIEPTFLATRGSSARAGLPSTRSRWPNTLG